MSLFDPMHYSNAKDSATRSALIVDEITNDIVLGMAMTADRDPNADASYEAIAAKINLT